MKLVSQSGGLTPERHVEALHPDVMAPGDGAFGRGLGSDDVMRVGLQDGTSTHMRKDSKGLTSPPSPVCTHTEGRPCVHAGRRQLSANQGESSPGKGPVGTLTTDFQPPGLSLKPPACDGSLSRRRQRSPISVNRR